MTNIFLFPAWEDDDYSGRIVNGYDIEIQEVPYQIGIFVEESFACGGSIISEKYILTAAHCLVYNKDDLMIHAGSSKLKEGGSFHKAVEVISHENYNTSTNENDIGLIEVHPRLPFDERRQPISLFRKEKILRANDLALVTGWGATSESGRISPQLQAVHVPLITNDLCQKQYESEFPIFKSQICAGFPEGEKDSCQGDSGGPMVIHKKLVGVVSWGKGCARAALPGVYTSVAHYIDWIEFHTQSES